MPDQEGRTSGPGTKSPDQAYKEGRSEDVQPGSLGADTGGAGEQVSRLTQDPDAGSEAGTAQSGGFAGQQADDSPDAGTISPGGSGDASPHAQYDSPKSAEAGGDLEVGEGSANPAPGSLGSDGPDEVGRRGYGQQPDYDATDPGERQDHPKTPS